MVPFALLGARGRFLPRRPVLSRVTLDLLVATYVMAADNLTLWRRGHEVLGGDPVTLAAFGGAFWALLVLLLAVFGVYRLQKPVLILILCLSAVTAYFQDNLGTTFDRDMVQNVVTTTYAEARHLVTGGVLAHVAVFGLLPSLLVLWVRVRPQRFMRALGTAVASAALALGVLVVTLGHDYRTYASAFREHKELQNSFQPGAPLAGALRYVRMVMRSQPAALVPVGADAAKGPFLRAAEKPVVLVIVVGETARAASFGLDGYTRDTTPELARRDLINFPDLHSCGTATAVSLPCMFSDLDRGDYTFDKGAGRENLLDVLGHAGVASWWIDNNTGDKGIARRTRLTRLTGQTDPAHCRDGECDDGVFQPLVDEAIQRTTTDTVLVLHMIGSHGPAYHLRYPPAFERFTPACRSADFSVCSREEIRNAYDNTIVYTDHVLARLIDDLAAQDRVIPALLYVSDHGESLGEGGLYLHGAPYFLAPEVQTKVPMILWMSERFQAAMGVGAACIDAQARESLSHDVLFHTVLGLMDIGTSARQDGLDLTAVCRAQEITGNHG